MDRVTVIIPAYNVENHIEKCIKSVMVQSYTDLEILVVDDGSLDQTPVILKQYSLLDRRIKVVTQSNKGVAAARNTGLREATGNYIAFVDSDDYVLPNYISNLMFLMKRYDTDVSVTRISNIRMNNQSKADDCRNLVPNQTIVLSGKEALNSLLLMKEIAVAVYGKLYRRELFEEIIFPEGKIYEDLAVVPFLLARSKNVSYNPVSDYYYVTNRNMSIMNKKFDARNYDRIQVSKNLQVLKTLYPDLGDSLDFQYIRSIVQVMNNLIASGDDHKRELLELQLEASKYMNRLIRSNTIGIKDKLLVKSASIPLALLKPISKIYNFIYK